MNWKKSWGGKELKSDRDFDGTMMTTRCYESHPKLKIGKGVLYGGSANHPIRKDADVYVSLQRGSSSDLASDPWADQHVVEVHYPIEDGHAPQNLKRFKKMIDWLCNQLQEGKKVHVGCIGGHGRTGMVLTAIVVQMLDEKDAIQYVRKHYCKKVVESREQVKFLETHYGVSHAEPTKDYSGGKIGFIKSNVLTEWRSSPREEEFAASEPVLPLNVAKDARTFAPLTSARCIWRKKS